MLQVFTLKDATKWDEIVKSFKDTDVYYLSGYVKGFEVHGDGEPLMFYYNDDSLRGINVVMKRDIALCSYFMGKIDNNTYFDFATPYGYGGWIIEGNNDSEKLFKAYEKWCIDNNVISEFVRFHPVTDNQKYSTDAYEVIRLSNTVCLDLADEEVIWSNFTSKNRNMIRKAQKNGLTVEKGLSKELFDTFREIYNATMDKDNATDYYYFGNEYYESILSDLKNNAQIFYTKTSDGQTAASAIMLYENGKLNYHLSGSRHEFQSLAPTNLLLYEAAVWGSNNGCKTLHLGGGVGSAEDSLLAFKKAFYRGELCVFHIGKKIFNNEIYNMLTEKRDNDTERNYFPKYRA